MPINACSGNTSLFFLSFSFVDEHGLEEKQKMWRREERNGVLGFLILEFSFYFFYKKRDKNVLISITENITCSLASELKLSF